MSGLFSVSASCVSAGATRSTGSRMVASMRLAVSADFVIWGITVRIGSSMSSSIRFIRSATALRLSMVWRKLWTTSTKLVTAVRNCSADRDIAASGLFEPNSESRSLNPGERGEEVSYRAWPETLVPRPGAPRPRAAVRRPQSPHGRGELLDGGHEQTRLRSPAAASMRPTGGKYLVTRSPSEGKAASSRG